MQVSSSEVRAEFERWLATECHAGARLVVLEGLSYSGKSYLIGEPFILGARRSINIETDEFLRRPVQTMTAYRDAIDLSALKATAEKSLGSSPLVVIQGVIGWPLVQSVASAVGLDRVRRVYLKRMRYLNPDIWMDESVLFNNESWSPNEFSRSILRYHAEQRPWRDCDLVLKRVVTEQE